MINWNPWSEPQQAEIDALKGRIAVLEAAIRELGTAYGNPRKPWDGDVEDRGHVDY